MEQRLFFLLLALSVTFAKIIVKRQADEVLDQGPPCSTDTQLSGVCKPPSQCPAAFDTIEAFGNNTCPLQVGTEDDGVCCPDQPLEIVDSPIQPLAADPVFRRQSSPPLLLASDAIGNSINSANEAVKERNDLEQELLQKGLFVEPGSAEDLHAVIVSADPLAESQSSGATFLEEASKDLAPRLFSAPPQIISGPRPPQPAAFSSFSIGQTRLATACPKKPACPATKYRSIDGTCNNVNHTEWGMAFGAFQRMAPAQYADGLEKPRLATDGTALPSARVVSAAVLEDVVKEFPDISLFYMAFGQFVDHDLTFTPEAKGANRTVIECCPPKITDKAQMHPECLPIEIPSNDTFYGPFNKTCLRFVRTLPAERQECILGPREQINQITSYIDASQIYGSSERSAEELRSKSGGKLIAGAGSPGKEFPPQQGGSGCSGSVESGLYCLKAGDTRLNIQPQLATLHVAFFREHNRIADELAKLNPGWGDEQLYQESRRILGAIMQHVIYNEYLPVVLGNRVMKRFGLLLTKRGFSDSYDPNLDSSILNEFATAAFRFGHSAVPTFIKLVNAQHVTTEQQLRTKFVEAYDTTLYNDYVRGLLTQGSPKIDEGVTQEITNHLFNRKSTGFGLDLPALNMQRGRDHAIASYTQMRKVCGLGEVKSFQDLNKYIDSNVAAKFSKLYKSVDDIDLWIGGIVERHLPGATVGSTFACIIAEQFKRTKLGDRFWYERRDTESSFSQAQLSQIRQSSLARILCDNSEITAVQPLVLLKPSQWNSQVSCNSRVIPKMSFRPWRNEPVWS